MNSLGEQLFELKKEKYDCWYVYSGGLRVIECGRHSTEKEANQSAIDFFDILTQTNN